MAGRPLRLPVGGVGGGHGSAQASTLPAAGRRCGPAGRKPEAAPASGGVRGPAAARPAAAAGPPRLDAGSAPGVLGGRAGRAGRGRRAARDLNPSRRGRARRSGPWPSPSRRIRTVVDSWPSPNPSRRFGVVPPPSVRRGWGGVAGAVQALLRSGGRASSARMTVFKPMAEDHSDLTNVGLLTALR